jgi:hypothetical protein
VQNAVDAAALAAAQELPDNGASAQAIAEQWAESNDSDITPSELDVSFRCIIGDRDHNNLPDMSDVPVVCNPGAGATWTCTGNICWAHCNFSGANKKCNTIVVGAAKDVPFYFAPVLAGLNGPDECFYDECSTGDLRAAACRGACGESPAVPLDVALVIDRSNSMSATDLTNAKDGAKSVLQLFNPTQQHVALAVLGASNPGSPCGDSLPGNWLTVPLSSNYKNADGTLNTGSTLVSRINCLLHSSQGTNLGDPMDAARQHLLSSGRANVKKAIIFLTDGAANQPVLPPVAANTGNRNCTAQAAVTSSSGDNNGFQSGAGNACTDASGQAVDTDSGNGTSTSCGSTNKDRHTFRDYNISLPAGATITGIQVRLDAWVDSTSSTSTRQMCAELSWNGGASWTSAKNTSNLSTSQATYTLGGSSDNWGRTWSASDTSNGNFRLRITNVANNNSRDFSLDWAAVNVHYTTPHPLIGPCNYAYQEALHAQSANIEIFTIGFGVEDENCDESGSPYHNQPVTELLADMATDSLDDHGHCDNATENAAENADGDHFLCEARSGDLSPIFTQAAETLATGSKMVPVYD